MAEYAAYKGPGYNACSHTCPTCKQQYTGTMVLGLAEALWERLNSRLAEDGHRLAAQNNLAEEYRQAGRDAEAEALYRDVLASAQRVHSPNHESTLSVAANLGNVLLNQGKYTEAEAAIRDTLARRVVLGHGQ